MDTGADERGRQVRARLLGGAAAPAAATAGAVGVALALFWPAAVPLAEASRTGRLLVTYTTGPRAHAAAARRDIAGARVTQRVPQIRLLAVRPRTEQGAHALADRLRAQPGVASVQPEHRAQPRALPNDPALTQADPATGQPYEFWVQREGFPAAWDVTRGSGATVAVIDSGIDGGHPDLAGHVVKAIDYDPVTDTPATTDQSGHGTFDASIACAVTDNGVGIAGAGWNCGLIVIKTDFSDSSIARAIVTATDDGADAINMSFGTDGSAPAARAVVDAIHYAADHGVPMVSAAADDPVTEQGDPPNVLQPTGTGPDIKEGLGLSVTSADAADVRSSFAGYGTQISMAAYGSRESASGPARLGLLGAFPSGFADVFATGADCTCRTVFDGDARYALLRGTSMAAPQVAAAAALIHHLNPDLGDAGTIRLLKDTARRPGGTWTADLGWGILDAGAAVQAATRLDRHPPTATLSGPRTTRRRTIRVELTATDGGPSRVVHSGVRDVRVLLRRPGGRYAVVARTTRRAISVRLGRGRTYELAAQAVDRAGNVGRRPRPQLTVRVGR